MNSFDLMIERYKQQMKEFDKKVNQNSVFNNEKLAEPLPDEQKFEVLSNRVRQENEFGEAVSVANMTAATLAENAELEQYEKNENLLSGEGSLVVQAFMSSEVYPIVSALVVVTENESAKVIFEGYTDVNGKTVEIKLPAPSEELSQQPLNIEPYSLYDIEVSHPKYKPRKYIAAAIFDGVKAIQPVQLVPAFSTNVADDVIITKPPVLGGEING